MGEAQGNSSPLSHFMDQSVGQACYVYDLKEIAQRYKALSQSVFGSGLSGKIHYAVKANGNSEILKTLRDLGAGVDVVSGGEIRRSLDVGFSGLDVIFSGVAKSHSEIALAMKSEIAQINVESPQELERIGMMATEIKKKIPVAFRMNPEVNPETHPYITTGLSENKFGMTKEFLPQLLRILKQYPLLDLVGLTIHIGSQIQNLSVYGEALEIIKARYNELIAMGHNLKTLDIGGGLGIDYASPDHDKDLQAIKDYGLLVNKHLKESAHKNFAIVNTGMHHLLRPALYQAQHRILPLLQRESSDTSGAKKFYDVVGPICESSDFLGKDRLFGSLQQGDFLAICDSGAYGYSMASGYNDHALPQEFVLSS